MSHNFNILSDLMKNKNIPSLPLLRENTYNKINESNKLKSI